MLGQLSNPRVAQRLALMQMAQPDATATPQQNNLPVPQQGTPGTGLEQLAEALGITKDGLAEGAYPITAMSTATQQTNQMPTRPAPQLRQAPGMSLDQLLQAAQFAVGNPDVAVQAARELPGGVGGVAELLPASDLERALELGGPALGMAGPVVRAGKKAAQAARSVAQRLHPLEQKMLDKFGLARIDAGSQRRNEDVGFVLTDGSLTSRSGSDHGDMAAATLGEGNLTEDDDRWGYINSFIEDTGAIRASVTPYIAAFDVAEGVAPTRQQVREIARIAKGVERIELNVGESDQHFFNTIGEMQRFFEGQ